MDPRLIHTHFDVSKASQQKQLLAWRERVGHVVDVVLNHKDIERPFKGIIDRYQAGDLAMTNCRSDDLQMDRSIGRISTDRSRGFAFHVFLSGAIQQLSVHNHARGQDVPKSSVLVLDLDQPVRMHRGACEMLTFFAPRDVVEAIFPTPEALHGRGLSEQSPLMCLIMQTAVLLNAELPKMGQLQAHASIRHIVELIVTALSKQAQLSGSARATARAVMYAQVTHYIQANIDNPQLSPDSILAALHLSRPTLYRMFQHEGGLAAYIRHRRLRYAANEITQRAHLDIAEIAYGLGFGSPSDFSRAFRRAYDIAPHDLRMMSFAHVSMPNRSPASFGYPP